MASRYISPADQHNSPANSGFGEYDHKQPDASLDALNLTFDRIDAKLKLIISMIEKRNSQCSSPSVPNRITPGSSQTPIQVTTQNLESNRDNSPLGYRAKNLNVAYRDCMLRKAEMPMFAGKQPYNWLIAVERFFHIGKYKDSEKLALVHLSLEGMARKWFNWELWRKGFKDWSEFKRRLILTFSEASENSDIANHEMPSFDGTDPYEWLEQSERFFRIGKYNDEAKLSLVFLYLEGEARKWFCRRRFLDWNEFKCRLMVKFAPVKNDSPTEVKLKDDPNSNGGAAHEAMLENESTLGIVQATDLRNELDSTTSLEMTTSEVKLTDEPNSSRGAVHEPYVVQRTKSPLREECQEQSGDSVYSLVQTGCISILVSWEEKNSVPSIHIDVIEAEAIVTISQRRNGLGQRFGAHRIIALSHRIVTTKNKQRKNLKAWRFKFKHRAEKKDLQSVFSYVMRRQNSYNTLAGTFSKRYILQLRKMSLSPKSWMFKYKSKVLRISALQCLDASGDNVGLTRKRKPLHSFQLLQQLNSSQSLWEMTVCHNKEEETSKEWPAGENKAVAAVFQFLSNTKPATSKIASAFGMCLSRLRCKNELWHHSQGSELLKEESSELFFHHSVASSYEKIEHSILRPKWVFMEDSPRCLTLFLSHGFDLIYNPASEYNNTADVFQFLKDTKPATS